MIKRKNDKDLDRGLQGVFYIVDCSRPSNEDWWQLRLRENHYVVSAVGGKAKVLECLDTICKRYKTYKKLHKALKNCEFKVSKEEMARRVKEYRENGIQYNEEVDDIVSVIMADLSSAPKKRQRIIPTTPVPVVEKVLEELTPKDIITKGKKLPPKKKVLLIK